MKVKHLKEKLLAMLTITCLTIMMMSMVVFAEEVITTEISMSDCTIIGYHEDYECNIYYYKIENATDVVELVDHADNMSEGTITGLLYTGYTDSTNVVNLSSEFALANYYDDFVEGYGGYLEEGALEEANHDNLYGFFVMDDGGDCYVYIIEAEAEEEQVIGEGTFEVSIDGVTISEDAISKTEEAYEYFDYMSYKNVYVNLYTVTIPCDATEVTINVDKDSLFYNYDGEGNYLDGWVADYTIGSKVATVKVDSNKDNVFDFIQVQNPYNADYTGGELRYAITFEVGHAWEEEYTVDTPATCTKAGTESIHCEKCSATKDSRSVKKVAHTWNKGTVTKAATALTAGVRTYKCKHCDATKKATIKKLTPTIKLNYAKKSLLKGRSFILRISGLAKGDSVKSVTVGNRKIASVKKVRTNTYRIKGLKKGRKTTVLVTLKSGKTKRCVVTVK